ncbi:MAG: M14 family zinc carboxypeptidase [Phycisphaerales bacterium JB039]
MRQSLANPLSALVVSIVLLGCAASGPARPAQPAESETPDAGALSPLPDQPYDYFDGLQLEGAVPTPESVLGYRIGARYTRHADIVDYLEALAASSDRVQYHRYGATVQGRPLTYLVISAAANLEDLDAILERNLELTDPAATNRARADAIIAENPAIVWLSYGVHGDEASAAEAAIQVAYTLAAGQNEEITEILDKCVIAIDPLLNPDGRDRYVFSYQNARGAEANPNADDAEHDQPWPGGRTNHYLFDLNRDWLWLTQAESRQRLAVYKRFMPQLHIDYHEQGHRSPYFFGPGDNPYNRNIPEETKDWLAIYGDANAEVFDREGLVYSTKERFDYLYPGYGKVLPVYNGAVGLLCEKAGGVGLAIEISDQYTLTLTERVRHHFLTSMSYLETTAANRQGQLERFARFFREASDATGDGPRTFAILPDNDPALLDRLWRLCQAHGVHIRTLNAAAPADGFTSSFGDPADGDLPEGTWIISAAQPMGRLVRAVFERQTEVEDADTYDVTAWSLPIAFGLRALESDAALDAPTSPLDWPGYAPQVTGDGDIALIIDSASARFPAAAGAIMRHDVFCRVATEPFTIDDRTFAAGSFIIHRVRNSQRDLDALIADILAAGAAVHRAGAGTSTEGPVLGANANAIYRQPKVLLLRGEGAQAGSAGHHWWFLDVDQPIPHTKITIEQLDRLDLSPYNVLVMPDMRPLSERAADKVQTWVRAGGVVVASGGIAGWASRTLAGAAAADADAADEEPPANQLSWQQRKDRSVTERISGAMTRIDLDTTHPLAAGLGPAVGVVKRGDGVLPVADAGYVVGRYGPIPRTIISGPVSERNLGRLAGHPAVTHHRVGAGAVICLADDPSLRGFQHAPMRLVLNAIVYGPTLSDL